MLKDHLAPLASQLRGHVELRAQVSTSHAVAMLNGDLQSNARAQQGGVSARVYRIRSYCLRTCFVRWSDIDDPVVGNEPLKAPFSYVS